MKFSSDYEIGIEESGRGSNIKKLLTLGEPQMIQLEDGRNIELLPYLISRGIIRTTSLKDPRRRRHSSKAIPLLAEAYASHYNNAEIGESWTAEEVTNMMKWYYEQDFGRFFLVKWAREVDSEREFPVGFIAAYSKPYHQGNMLWDGEIFVLPEYQRHGIGKELVTALLTIARESQIRFFETLTYEGKNGNPLGIWKNYGVTATDLVHISVEIDTMLMNMNGHEGENKVLGSSDDSSFKR